MPTTAELIRKELEEQKKRDEQHKARMKKFEEKELKRVYRILKQAEFFGVEISDDELLDEFRKIVQQKKRPIENSADHLQPAMT